MSFRCTVPGRLIPSLIVALLLAPLLFSLGGPPSEAAAQQTPRATRKVLVETGDAKAVADLTRRGGLLLVEYGAFALWRIPETEAPAAARANASVSVKDDFDTIGLRGGGAIDTRGTPPVPPAGLAQARTNSPQLWLVQFIGPIKEAWLDDLRANGLQIVWYMPQNAYVVWGDGAAIDNLTRIAQKSPVIQFTGAYHPAYRLAPSLLQAARTSAAADTVSVTVQFYTTSNTGQSIAALRALGGTVRRALSSAGALTNLSLDVPIGQVTAIANWPDVFNVEPYIAPKQRDEAQGQIVAGNLTTSGGNVVPAGGAGAYLAWLASKGFPTVPSSYPIIDVVDDGIDNGTATPTHPDFFEIGSTANPDRLVYNQDCTADPSANGVHGHGNINASIVGAYNNLAGSPHQDSRGFRLDLGISPFGRLAGTKIFSNSGPFDPSACGNSLQGLVLASFNAGATITSNSWGADVFGAYDADAQAYDVLSRDAAPATAGNQQMLHVFSAGNAGPGANTVGSPGTAKNVLSVGATENVRDQGSLDGCGFANADNADDLAPFSARGPTDDDRVKPDIVAPGVHVQGAASQDPDFNGLGVCGGPAPPPDNRYYPAGQTLYTWSSGTSHSAPAVAGAVSLLYNYYGRVLNPGGTPSPAMLKALLLNSPRYLNGSGGGDTLPSNTQGWGDVNLGSLFDGAPRALVDQLSLFTASGQEVTQTGKVANSGNPLRVTLAWTDPPGSTTGNAFVNDLDLEVTVGGNTYKGNVFSGATSTAGGAADARNNVENVFLPAGLSGTVIVRVVARNLAGDGLPGNGSAIDQDFALVIYNGTLADLPVLQQGTVTTGDASGNNNGFVDPGENTTLLAAMQNVGTATATNVNGALAVTGGSATIVTGTSPYPNIASNATAPNSTPYRFVVSPSQPCGSLLTFQHTVTYTGGGPAVASLPVRIGKPVAGALATYTSPNVPTAIPDAGASPAVVNLSISGVPGTIADINVRVNVTHTWDSDLVMQLVSPDGQTVVTLVNQRGGSGDNFTNTVLDDEAGASISTGSAPFSGSFRPETPLAALDGLPIDGTWQLRISDLASVDVGTVTGFQLDIVPQLYECATVTNSPDLSVSATDSPDPVLQGSQLTYAVTVTSAGATAGSPTVTIGLLGWDEDGLTSTCPGAFTLQGSPGNRSATCSVGTFAAAGNKSFTVTFAPQNTGTVANAISVTSQQPDPNPGNNSVDVSTTVNPNAACSPRPRVQLPVARIGICHLRTTVTAGFGHIQYIQFQKGIIDIQGGPSNQGDNFRYYPPAGSNVVIFDFRSSPPSEGITTNLTIKDGCGKWNTFVGMGTGPW
jgi:subtilisin-like proprotein convertase family protein